MQGPQGPYGHNPYHMAAGPMMAPPFQCRACGHVGQAMTVSKITTGGWILAIAMFCLLCWPLCWIPLVAMKEQHAQCPRCRVMA